MRRLPVTVVLAVLMGIGGCTAGTGAPPTVASHSSTATQSPAVLSPSATPTAASSATDWSGSVSATSDDQSATSPASTPTAASDIEPPDQADPVPDTGFSGTISVIEAALATRMTSSWRDGCPVPLADLRYVTLTYRGFDGADHQGEMVVAASVADDVVAIFRRLYEIGYPIASMRLVDDFGGDDDASMSANNTSAFNCRPVTGGGGFSEHSYGTAIDVDPVQNPYLSGSTVLPAEGLQYVDRPDAPGVIHPGDQVVQAFADHGFSWGGYWTRPIDYQHFSASGR